MIKFGFDRMKSGQAAEEKEATAAPDPSVRRFLTGVLPQVSRELKRWDKQLNDCADWTLLRQALSSLYRKRFHSQGGCFYALYNPRHSRRLVSLIVALQTISDYLDSLCDRGGIYDEAAFRCLHRAMLDALSIDTSPSYDYYRFYHAKNDGGYLAALVNECRSGVETLPAFPVVQSEVLRLVSLYNDLQVYKHLHPLVRHARLKRWYREKRTPVSPPVYFWEFAAACGSTLAVFALFSAAASARTTEEDVRRLVRVYFPWICGLHILLDYWIDQEEDQSGDDFNFAACYPSPEVTAMRLHLFLNKSLEGVSRLPHPSFHRTVVRGLLAVYLSDPKVARQGLQQTAGLLIDAAGTETRLLYRLCRLLRKTGLL